MRNTSKVAVQWNSFGIMVPQCGQGVFSFFFLFFKQTSCCHAAINEDGNSSCFCLLAELDKFHLGVCNYSKLWIIGSDSMHFPGFAQSSMEMPNFAHPQGNFQLKSNFFSISQCCKLASPTSSGLHFKCMRPTSRHNGWCIFSSICNYYLVSWALKCIPISWNSHEKYIHKIQKTTGPLCPCPFTAPTPYLQHSYNVHRLGHSILRLQ